MPLPLSKNMALKIACALVSKAAEDISKEAAVVHSNAKKTPTPPEWTLVHIRELSLMVQELGITVRNLATAVENSLDINETEVSQVRAALSSESDTP